MESSYLDRISSYLNQSIIVRKLVVCVRLAKYFLISATVSVSYSSQDERRNSFSIVGVQKRCETFLAMYRPLEKPFPKPLKVNAPCLPFSKSQGLTCSAMSFSYSGVHFLHSMQ
jgi:hypothetical protein